MVSLYNNKVEEWKPANRSRVMFLKVVKTSFENAAWGHHFLLEAQGKILQSASSEIVKTILILSSGSTAEVWSTVLCSLSMRRIQPDFGKACIDSVPLWAMTLTQLLCTRYPQFPYL